MVKVHFWKSELALLISALESYESKEKPSGVRADLFKDTTRKLNSAYKEAQR